MPRRSPPIQPHDLPTFFAAQLRKRRSKAGLSMDALGDEMGYTGTWIWQVENCAEKPSRKFGTDCDTYWQTDEWFEDLAKAIERPGEPAPAPVPGFDEFQARELQASSIRRWEADLIAGLLQTEDYARAVCTSAQRTAAQTDAMVRGRMERQAAVLDRDNPPRLWVVQDEHALRSAVAPLEVMRAQWQHLIELASRPRVHLQVVPDGIGYHEGKEGSFTVLNFEHGTHDVAYMEAGGHGQLLEEVETVASYAERLELIRNVALTTSATIELVTALWESSQ
ncbi:helix-turn-helix transcriptional regulator [Spirillospora sp. NPDC052269]